MKLTVKMCSIIKSSKSSRNYCRNRKDLHNKRILPNKSIYQSTFIENNGDRHRRDIKILFDKIDELKIIFPKIVNEYVKREMRKQKAVFRTRMDGQDKKIKDLKKEMRKHKTLFSTKMDGLEKIIKKLLPNVDDSTRNIPDEQAHQSARQKVQCPICEDSFDSQNQVDRHNKETHVFADTEIQKLNVPEMHIQLSLNPIVNESSAAQRQQKSYTQPDNEKIDEQGSAKQSLEKVQMQVNVHSNKEKHVNLQSPIRKVKVPEMHISENSIVIQSSAAQSENIPDEQEKLECPMCGTDLYAFKLSDNETEKHMKLNDKFKELQLQNKKVKECQENFKCEICDEKFDSKIQFDDHNRAHFIS